MAGTDRGVRALHRLHGAARWALPLVLVVACLLRLPTVALARGGGGGHGAGGGGSGGGSGGFGGDGDSSDASGISGSGVEAVVFVIALAVAVLLAYLYLSRTSAGRRLWPQLLAGILNRSAPSTAAGAAMTGPSSPVPVAVTAIREADPDFEPETFLQRSEMAFLLVMRAYQDRNVHAARAFLSPPLWQLWRKQVEQLIAARQRPVLENLNVRGMQVPGVRHESTGDLVQVHIDYVAAARVVDEASGRLVSGATADQRLGELWTFERGPSARMVLSGGATASKCPNCGALLKLNDDGVCNHCGADITSGGYDWVATRIEAASFVGASTPAAFGAAEMDPQTGLKTLRTEDPSFDVESFRGRVQQAFFALQQAWQDRDLASSRPFMSPGLYLGWSSQVQQLIELHKKNVLEDLRVDHIDVVKVVLDDVTARVVATCADYEVDERTGRTIFGDRNPRPFTEYWTFQRSVGTRTTDRSILDWVCPNCGAPLAGVSGSSASEG